MTDPLEERLRFAARTAGTSARPPNLAVLRARSRRRRAGAVGAPLAVTVAVAVLLLSALDPGPDRLPSYAAPTATASRSNEPPRDVSRAAIRPGSEDASRTARAEGVLQADPVSGCLWVETASVSLPVLLKGDSLNVDFTAERAVVRRAGTQVAAMGEHVVLTGGSGQGSPYYDPVPGCPVGGQPFLGTLDDAPAEADHESRTERPQAEYREKPTCDPGYDCSETGDQVAP